MTTMMVLPFAGVGEHSGRSAPSQRWKTMYLEDSASVLTTFQTRTSLCCVEME